MNKFDLYTGSDVVLNFCSGSDVVRGYDFLVNSVWPEVVSNIEARTGSIFAPGNPDIFHAVSILENVLHPV